MQAITCVAELKSAIHLLEVEQAVQGQALKEQFNLTYNSLKPINLFKSTFKEVVTSPNVIDNVIGTALGFASGFLTQKMVVGASSSIARKVIGSVIQLGVTNVIARHPVSIKSVGAFLFNRILRRKDRIVT
jgi:hypothetical protein